MRYLSIFFIFFGLLGAFKVNAFDIKTNLIDAQNMNYVNLGTYTHVPITKELDYSYTIHEYETPDKSYGYQIIFTYPDRVESFGYGKEELSRTFVKQIDTTSTTTKTIIPITEITL